MSTRPRPFFRRRKSCPFSSDSAPKIDYKDVKLLQRFTSERGQDRAEPDHSCFRQKTT